MSELTWRSGTPSHLEPVGDCVLTRFDDGTIRIERADPKILVSAELLDELRYGCNPHVILDGNVLRIIAANRRVIYRIGEKVPDLHAFYAEWPD